MKRSNCSVPSQLRKENYMIDTEFLCRSRLFRGFTKEEITSLLECLNAAVKTYRKGEYIFQAGDVTENFGMIIEGKVQIISDDYWGERQILAGFGKGQLFGEAYACMEKMPLLVSAIAVEESQVLMLNAHRVLQTCTSACDFHRRLVENLVGILAKKNLTLTRKIDQISKKTIRGKVLAYLSSEAGQQDSNDITVPFNRQQLAEYLAVDRSALSAELSRMQKEGIISYRKNHFVLNKDHIE